MNRRHALGALGIAAAGTASVAVSRSRGGEDVRPQLSKVLILNVSDYASELDELLFRAVSEFKLDVGGKRVLLKPNLVEFAPDAPVNTHNAVVGAAIGCFQRLGAAYVTVGEGPGHERDTEVVIEGTGIRRVVAERAANFVDLNRDSVRAVPSRSCYTDLGTLWLPETVLAADLIVSMPKIKTHHWAGVTLSMKNMFGVLPGSQYGWPKNVLHWAGIHESILDICSTVRPSFVIADGIEAMEGNGPLHGKARHLHKLVLGDDPVAADVVCLQLMGLRPDRVRHIAEAARFLGNGRGERIALLGENVLSMSKPFEVVPEFRFLQGAGGYTT